MGFEGAKLLCAACRYCGAVVGPTGTAVGGLCLTCSEVVADAATKRAAASTAEARQVEMRAPNLAPSAEAALAELVAQGRGPSAPMDGKVLNAGKTLVSLVALIPIAGAYFIYRSLLHTEAEKYKLAWISIAVTALAATWLIVQLPRPAKFDPGVRSKLESDFNALGAMAEQYRLEHGDLPDPGTWRGLPNSEDSSFYDPWGKPYQYERTVDGVTIRTLGRDGVNGGTGMDADLSAHFSVPANSVQRYAALQHGAEKSSVAGEPEHSR